jgi:hypothetical protein
MREYEFSCRFTSPFHSAAHQTANLQTCAPYVLGSTLRGAVLRHLIDRYCPSEHLRGLLKSENNLEYHRNCPQADCPIRNLFNPKELEHTPELWTRFTFGFFVRTCPACGEETTEPFCPRCASGQEPPEAPPRKRPKSGLKLHHRLGIARDTRTAAAGNLLSAETRWGEFRFAVRVPRSLCCAELVEAVKKAGRFGVGRFRSAGWGRFEIVDCRTLSPPALVPAQSQAFILRTPYVLKEEPSPELRIFTEARLQEDLKEALGEGRLQVEKAEEQVGGRIYLRRWSYETNGRENAVAVDPVNTTLRITFAASPTAADLQALTWGLGRWGECGFGALIPAPEGMSATETRRHEEGL